jgi:hypothetical protein
LAARRIDHDSVFAEQLRCGFFAHAAMIPRMLKIGRSRVDTGECANMIFDGCPEVIRADSTAFRNVATETQVVFANATCMETA